MLKNILIEVSIIPSTMDDLGTLEEFWLIIWDYYMIKIIKI